MVDNRTRGPAPGGSAGAQVGELKQTVADLGERVAGVAAERARSARGQAQSAARSMRDASSSLYEDSVEALSAAGDQAVYYGRRAGSMMRANPGISLLGFAVAVGVVAAIVYASREDDRRWYERRRSGWF